MKKAIAILTLMALLIACAGCDLLSIFAQDALEPQNILQQRAEYNNVSTRIEQFFNSININAKNGDVALCEYTPPNGAAEYILYKHKEAHTRYGGEYSLLFLFYPASLAHMLAGFAYQSQPFETFNEAHELWDITRAELEKECENAQTYTLWQIDAANNLSLQPLDALPNIGTISSQLVTADTEYGYVEEFHRKANPNDADYYLVYLQFICKPQQNAYYVNIIFADTPLYLP